MNHRKHVKLENQTCYQSMTNTLLLSLQLSQKWGMPHRAVKIVSGKMRMKLLDGWFSKSPVTSFWTTEVSTSCWSWKINPNSQRVFRTPGVQTLSVGQTAHQAWGLQRFQIQKPSKAHSLWGWSSVLRFRYIEQSFLDTSNILQTFRKS